MVLLSIDRRTLTKTGMEVLDEAFGFDVELWGLLWTLMSESRFWCGIACWFWDSNQIIMLQSIKMGLVKSKTLIKIENQKKTRILVQIETKNSKPWSKQRLKTINCSVDSPMSVFDVLPLAIDVAFLYTQNNLWRMINSEKGFRTEKFVSQCALLLDKLFFPRKKPWRLCDTLQTDKS